MSKEGKTWKYVAGFFFPIRETEATAESNEEMESGWIERTISSKCSQERQGQKIKENERRRDVLLDGQVELRDGARASRIIQERQRMRNRLSSMRSNYSKPAKSSKM